MARNPEKAAELSGAAEDGELEIVTADCRDANALQASGVARDVDAVVRGGGGAGSVFCFNCVSKLFFQSDTHTCARRDPQALDLDPR